jgi:hypothetical protein
MTQRVQVVAPVEKRLARDDGGVASPGALLGAVPRPSERGGAARERRERARGALGEHDLARAEGGGGEAAQAAPRAELEDASAAHEEALVARRGGRGVRVGVRGFLCFFGACGGGVEGVRQDARGAPDAPRQAGVSPGGLVDVHDRARARKRDALHPGGPVRGRADLRAADRHELHRLARAVASALLGDRRADGVHQLLVPAASRAVEALQEHAARAVRVREARRARVRGHGARERQKRVAAAFRARGYFHRVHERLHARHLRLLGRDVPHGAERAGGELARRRSERATARAGAAAKWRVERPRAETRFPIASASVLGERTAESVRAPKIRTEPISREPRRFFCFVRGTPRPPVRDGSLGSLALRRSRPRRPIRVGSRR